MKIALEFPSPLGGYGVRWVDVVNVEELRAKLKADKVTECSRYSRCIGTGDGRCDGPSVSIESLTQDDLQWASEQEAVRSRYLLCMRPLI